MPDKMLDALEKLLVHTGPAKPQRKIQNIYSESPPKAQKQTLNNGPKKQNSPEVELKTKVVLETSFTDSPLIAQNAQNTKRLNSRSVVRPNQLITQSTKVDFMRDDWFGAAPLASPETMSDVSSISSRSNGVRASWATLPVFTINNDRQLSEERVVSSQPSAEHSRYQSSGEVIVHMKEEMNIPLVESDVHNDSNVNRNDVLNKNFGNNRKALNLSFISGNNEEMNENNEYFGLLEVKDQNYNNPSSNSSDNNAQEYNSTEIPDSRCESTNEVDESLPALHRFSSDTDLSNTLETKPPPLRRSHEEIHLNDLDDSRVVFEAEPLTVVCEPNGAEKSNSDEVSPTLRMLFHKLLTIESPTTESYNQTTCDSDVNANQISSPFSGNQF